MSSVRNGASKQLITKCTRIQVLTPQVSKYVYFSIKKSSSYNGESYNAENLEDRSYKSSSLRLPGDEASSLYDQENKAAFTGKYHLSSRRQLNKLNSGGKGKK